MTLGSWITAVTGILLAFAATFLAGMRWKWPFVLDAVRRMNKALLNPRQMRSAGSPGAYAAVIHHVGRRSGTPYRTPIGPVPIDGGFVVTLPYGTRPDWVKNVLAAGSATLEFEGETLAVDRPEVVPVETVRAAFGPTDRRAQRVFAVNQCLRVRTAAFVETI